MGPQANASPEDTQGEGEMVQDQKKYGMAGNIAYIYRILFREQPRTKVLLAGKILLAVAQDIYQRFNNMVQDKTAIFISHRMSSCRFCDTVIVFDGGRIVQTGSHERLLGDKEGIYSRMWEAQAKYYI
ncbi:lactococcin-G-processing and transport ATP-binding protein LagD [Lachnospiraceae bacterium]|nr:hypothetical protein [Acetatifactor sp.]GFH96411.1 lactococcin-G-processing and transport ATP-binding protein LagD [Lachnospiraceae bacterium]